MCSAVWGSTSRGSGKAVVSRVLLARFSMLGEVVRALFVALDPFRVILGPLHVIHVFLAPFNPVQVCLLPRVIIVRLGLIPRRGVRRRVFPVAWELSRAVSIPLFVLLVLSVRCRQRQVERPAFPVSLALSRPILDRRPALSVRAVLIWIHTGQPSALLAL